jgi:hypothetical protein
MHFTKREMRATFGRRGVWIGLVAAGVVLGLAGPFDTDEVMRPLPSVVYWTFITMIGFGVGSLVSTFLSEVLRRAGVPRWPAVVVSGALAGVVLTALLTVVNTAVFGIGFLDPELLVPLWINVIVISVIISVAYVAMHDHARAQAGSAPDQPPASPMVSGGAPRILARVPIEKRGALMALSVQDHYVEVITDRGTELVLLRLSDAIEEVGATPGLQVHRSHWVAIPAVAAARRDGAKATLTLTNGRDIPVSRTYLPAVKEAGLLPG